MRTTSNVVTNSCCFSVSGPNSSDSHGNKELCILSHVCDKVSRSLLMSLIKLDFRSFYFITLGRLFLFLAVLGTNSARFNGFCKFLLLIKDFLLACFWAVILAVVFDPVYQRCKQYFKNSEILALFLT